uniref:Uncharacterized protein n=1 Tax=Arundo donax TaxID=35708 RepID=A0A0A8Z2X8_ARUDO
MVVLQRNAQAGISLIPFPLRTHRSDFLALSCCDRPVLI